MVEIGNREQNQNIHFRFIFIYYHSPFLFFLLPVARSPTQTTTLKRLHLSQDINVYVKLKILAENPHTTMEPDEFYQQIKDLKNPQAIEQCCDELLHTISPNWKNLKPKTIQNKLTPYNKLLRAYPVENLIIGKNAFIYHRKNGSEWLRHLYFQYTGLNSDQWQEINQPIQDLKVARLQNKAPIPPAPYIEITRKLLRSYNPHELAVGLIAATGRRKTEILARGEFTLPEQPVDYLHQDYQLIFSGQLKKREPEPPFAIGTLFPAKTVLLAWQRYRRTKECKQLLKRIEKLETENKSEQQITKIISDQRSHSIDRVVKKYYTTFLPPRHGAETDSAHTLRAASVHLITARECPKKIEPLLFASWQLGHFINDESVDNSKLTRIITSCGYLNYYVESEVPYPKDLGSSEIEPLLKIYQEDLRAFEQLHREWKLPNQAETFRKLIESSKDNGGLRQLIMELEEDLGDKSLEIEELKVFNQELSEKISSTNQEIRLLAEVGNSVENPRRRKTHLVANREREQGTGNSEEMEDLRTLNQELEQKVASYQQSSENTVSTEEMEELRTLNQELEQKVASYQQIAENAASTEEIDKLRAINQELEEKVASYQQILEKAALNPEIEEITVANSPLTPVQKDLVAQAEAIKLDPQKVNSSDCYPFGVPRFLSKETSQIATTNQELTNLIDSRIRLIIAQEIKSQLGHLAPNSVEAIDNTFSPPVSESKPPRITSNQKPVKDWSMVSNEELKPSKEKGAADEKVRRAYQSMANYNDYQAVSNDQRWFIGTRSLIEMSGCNYQVVKRWLGMHRMVVDDHNSKYGLGTHHNRKHVGEEIRQTIKLWEPSMG